MTKKENLKEMMKKYLSKMKDKVGSGIGSMMSYKTSHKGKKYDRYRKVITQARKYDDAPNFVDGKPTDAYKMRNASKEIMKKRKKEVAKEVLRNSKKKD